MEVAKDHPIARVPNLGGGWPYAIDLFPRRLSVHAAINTAKNDDFPINDFVEIPPMAPPIDVQCSHPLPERRLQVHSPCPICLQLRRAGLICSELTGSGAAPGSR